MRTLTIAILLFGASMSISTVCLAQSGKSQLELGKRLYRSCQNCHSNKSNIAPTLQNVRQIRGKEWVYKFTYNPAGFASSNLEARKLIAKWKVIMPAFPALTKAQINAICDYVDTMPRESKTRKA